MIDELHIDARDLFRAARDGLSPTPSDLERVHARVRVAVAGGAAGASSSTAATASLVVAAITGLSAIAWWMTRAPAPAPVPAPASISAPAVPEAAPPPAAIALPAPPIVTPIEDAAPVARHRPRRASVAPAVTPPAPITPSANRDPLAAELAHVHDAAAALAAGDPSTALAIARAALTERPDGQLAAEIAAIKIDALCALGRSRDARAAAAEMLARWPTSTLRARVNASCASSQEGAP